MLSPNPKVWSLEMKNVESKISRSRSVMNDACPTFRPKGDVYTNVTSTFGPNSCIVLSSSLYFLEKKFTLARLHATAEIRNPGMQEKSI